MTNQSKPTVSVVIPAFNEGRRLPTTLQQYLAAESELALPIIEYIIVDDGSTDNTRQIINGCQDARVRCLHRPVNQGKGAAVRHGAQAAQGDLVFIVDADAATSLTALNNLAPEIDTETIVIGSRYIDGSQITHRQPFSRRLISRGGNWLIQKLLLPGVKDTQCGCKLLTRQACQQLFPKLKRNGFSYDVELLHAARQQGYRLVEVPITWTHITGTSVHASIDSLRFLRDVWQLYQESRHAGR